MSGILRMARIMSDRASEVNPAGCFAHSCEGDRITAEIRQLLISTGRLKGESTLIMALDNCGLTEAERSEMPLTCRKAIFCSSQNAKGFRRRGADRRCRMKFAPLHFAKRYQVFRPKKLELAVGDRVRITHNGTRQMVLIY